MAAMRKYRRVMGVSWLAPLVLAAALAGCGPAATPQDGGGPANVQAPKSVVVVTKYADEWTDPERATEPALNQAGGIPPEDLTATPKMGGTVRGAGTGWTLARLDPHFQVAAASGWAYRVFGNGLLRWDLKTGTPQPDLAESWTVAKDGLSYDFKIRKGFKFHNVPPVNGRELMVQDIKWSMDRVSGLEPRPGRQGIFFRRYENVKEFQAVDDSTLRMVMKQPDVQILSEVMQDYMIVLPKEAGGAEDAYEQTKALIGSGPFLVDYAEGGGQLRFKRNPDYWEKDKAGRQLPYLDGIIGLPTTQNVAMQAAFKSRQIDYAALVYPNAKSLLGDPNVRYFSGRGLVFGAIGLYMNTTLPPFNDLRVRRAANLALDRVSYIDAALDGLEGAYVISHLGSWSPWTWSEDKVWSLPGFAKGEAKKKEKEEAKRLLAEAGYPNGIKNVELWSTYPDQFDSIQQEFAEVGIELKLQAVTGGLNRYRTFMQDKLMGHAQQGGGNVPDYAVTVAWLCNSVQNMSLYCNPDIDRLFLEERRERDTAKRIQIFDKMQQILWDDMPMVTTARTVNIQLSQKYMRGWRNHWYDLGLSQGYQMAQVWLDK